jgi:HPt (histidine-containing phosphotransfer) domain-containing protein
MVVTNAAQQNHFKNLNDLNHRSNYSPFIDVKTLTRLGDSIGKENVSNLVDAYLEHTAIAIAAMQRAILQHDFVTIEAECHSLKGGSSTFGATRLVDLCQEIESCSRYYIGAKHFTSEDIAKAQKLLDRMHSEYNILKQSIHRVLLAILDNGENALALTAQPLADKQLPQK